MLEDVKKGFHLGGTGAFEQKQTVPFAKLDTNHTMEVRFDPDEGEKGTAYFSCTHAGVVKIYRYDTATDTVPREKSLGFGSTGFTSHGNN